MGSDTAIRKREKTYLCDRNSNYVWKVSKVTFAGSLESWLYTDEVNMFSRAQDGVSACDE